MALLRQAVFTPITKSLHPFDHAGLGNAIAIRHIAHSVVTFGQSMSSEQLSLFVPDRFDMLQRKALSQLNSIVVAVDDALTKIKAVARDMGAAGRGAFLIFRGDSGSGKSTFLNTVGFFIEGVEVLSLSRQDSIESALNSAKETTAKLRIIVIEGRDALREVTASELEASIHEMNRFLRSQAGERTLVVWPVNADDLESALTTAAHRVGADALLGTERASYRFAGPPQNQYFDIASRTIATLNQGASLVDLGISQERAVQLASNAPTIGQFLGVLRGELLKNQASVEEFLDKERCRLWIIVAAGNDPEGDVAGLTRGASSAADIERLIGATNANIVQDLKQFPDRIGILSTVLDAKILHLPSVTALSISRDYADKKLTDLMTAKGLSTNKQLDAIERLGRSDIARAFSAAPMGTRARGPKPGSNTEVAFRKLAEIATKADQPLNAAIGSALLAAGYISQFETERDLGGGLTRYSDLVCTSSALNKIRLEVMWRTKTNRAEIANYTLGKLYNYGRAIGFLEQTPKRG
jgi:energy-coupling factor transporter ATP-binding protein EcfA2